MTPHTPGQRCGRGFPRWDVTVILWILTAAVQRLGGIRCGKAPSERHQHYVCDTSRMNCARAEPSVNAANILRATTSWTQPELLDQAFHQQFQRLKNDVPMIANESNVRALPISKGIPSNPKMAMRISMDLLSRQKERGQPVGEDYAGAVQTYMDLFGQY